MSSGPTYGAVYNRPGNHGSESPANESRLLSEVSSNTQAITSGVNQLELLVRQLGTSHDSARLRNELFTVEHNTQRLVSSTVALLKQLSVKLQSSNKRARRAQLERLSNEFKLTLGRFQRIVQSFRDRVDVYSNPDNIRHQPRALLAHSSDKTALLSDQDYGEDSSVMQMREVTYEVEVAQERAEQIKQIEKDILEIDQIFRELSTLVNEQGDKIDDIAANIESAAVHVDSANRALGRASHYQRSKRRRLCCLLLIVLVIVLAVIIIAVALSA